MSSNSAFSVAGAISASVETDPQPPTTVRREVIEMKVKFSKWFYVMACGIVLCAQGLVAQTTIQLFGPVSVATSLPSASYNTPYAFNTSTLNLTCPTSGIQATLSGPLMNSGGTAPVLVSGAFQPGGNILVDNNIIVTVTPVGNGLATPANVCPVSSTTITGEGLSSESCFNGTYESNALSLLGLDPDTASISDDGPTIDYAGGVPPIDISPYLATSGSPQGVAIALTDEGGQYDSSTVFLTTNCTVSGVSGGTISGSPFTSNPSSQVQTFTFDSNTGSNTQPSQIVSFTYDVSQVSDAGNGATPQATDAALAQAEFQTAYVPGTSFATSSCLIHTGEVLSNTTTPACKLYTLECIDPNTGVAAGVNCPVSDLANEGVTDFFDGPPFSLQNIYTPSGVFHEGIGFLMASDDWSQANGGPCSFEEAGGTPVASLPCPQNLLISFSGPGAFAGKGLTTNPNSTFVSIAGVPEDHTSVVVAGEWPDNWVNTRSPKVYFATQAPNLSKGASIQSGNKLAPLPNAANYIPAPIKSITYGISPAGSPLPLPFNEPIEGDLSLTPSTPCPTTLPTSPTEPNFAPAPVTLASLPDGQYLLHYFAQDCAGTQELQFILNPANTQNPAPYWTTNFYTIPIGIDTTRPVVATLTLPTPPAGGAYKLNSVVNASYECTDATTGAGVVLCGTYVYAPQTTYDTGNTHLLTTRINTSSVGTNETFTVYAADGAGNTSSKTITYKVSR